MTLTYDDIRSSIDVTSIDGPTVGTTDYFRQQGRMYSFTAHAMDDMSIMDEQGEGVWCGQLVWSNTRNSYGYFQRPDGFDGNAEIIDRDRHSVLWWQPMEDCKPNSDIRASVLRTIQDVREYGYVGIEVYDEETGATDALWGIEACSHDYHKEVVADLISDLYWQHHQDTLKRAEYLKYYAPDLERWLNY